MNVRPDYEISTRNSDYHRIFQLSPFVEFERLSGLLTFSRRFRLQLNVQLSRFPSTSIVGKNCQPNQNLRISAKNRQRNLKTISLAKSCQQNQKFKMSATFCQRDHNTISLDFANEIKKPKCRQNVANKTDQPQCIDQG